MSIVIGQSSFNQGLRTALGVSLLSGLPVKARGLKDDNPRSRPGLGRESLNLLALLARISQGKFTGVVGRASADFIPGKELDPQFTLSLSGLRFSEAPFAWVVETLLPALNNQPEAVHILLSGGGTHVFGGPNTEEINQLLLPLWQTMGFNMEYMEVTPGFHPNASGEVEITLTPNPGLKPLDLMRPFVAKSCELSAVVAGLPVYLAEQALLAASQRLEHYGFHDVQTSIRKPMAGQGQAITLWADNGGYRVGFSLLGRKGTRLESLVGKVVDDLREFCLSQSALPARQALWCLLPMTQADGLSKVLIDRPSGALRAAMDVVNQVRPGSVSLQQIPSGTVLLVQGKPWRYQPI